MNIGKLRLEEVCYHEVEHKVKHHHFDSYNIFIPLHREQFTRGVKGKENKPDDGSQETKNDWYVIRVINFVDFIELIDQMVKNHQSIKRMFILIN